MLHSSFSHTHRALLMGAAALLLLLVASAFGQEASSSAGGGGVSMCSQAECECRMPSVRNEGRSFTKTIGTKMCICICGSEINEDCKTDGQCVAGAYCKFEYSTADATFAADGKCSSNCNRQACPQFHECTVNDSGKAVCECSKYACDSSVVVPICAAAGNERAMQRFNNTCLFVNENCDRKQKGLTDMKSFVCMDS